jgi:hypothetical protein
MFQRRIKGRAGRCLQREGWCHEKVRESRMVRKEE